MEIVGADERTLADEWAGVPRAYLGLTVPGFPNLFLLYGPNTNGGTGSVIDTIEAGMAHVLAALRLLDGARARTIEVGRPTAEAFDRELRAALAKTVWHTGCTSWYLDEHGNDPNQWPVAVEHVPPPGRAGSSPAPTSSTARPRRPAAAS
jgi:hypothetical protein